MKKMTWNQTLKHMRRRLKSGGKLPRRMLLAAQSKGGVAFRMGYSTGKS